MVSLRVFDITGREVANLVNGQKIPGTYNVQFNGGSLASGVYFYRLQVGNFYIFSYSWNIFYDSPSR
jgi:hypothetical protein